MLGAFDTETRQNLCGTRATPEAVIAHLAHDPARALVLTWAQDLVAARQATWTVVEEGDIELRLSSGEIYRLTEAGVLRLA